MDLISRKFSWWVFRILFSFPFHKNALSKVLNMIASIIMIHARMSEITIIVK